MKLNLELYKRALSLSLLSVMLLSIVAMPVTTYADEITDEVDTSVPDPDTDAATTTDPTIAIPVQVDTSTNASSSPALATQKELTLKHIKNRVNSLNQYKKQLADTSDTSKIPSLKKDGSNYAAVVKQARKANIIGKTQRKSLNKEINFDLDALAYIAAATRASKDVEQVKGFDKKVQVDYRVYSYLKIKMKAMIDAATTLYLLNKVQSAGHRIKTSAESSDAPVAKTEAKKVQDSLDKLASTEADLKSSIKELTDSTVDSYAQDKSSFKAIVTKVTPSGSSSYYSKVAKAQKDIQAANKKLGIAVKINQRSGKPMPGDKIKVGDTWTGKGSSYGEDPKTGYNDPGDPSGSAASGISNRVPGVSLYNKGTLKGWWKVTAPNGKTAVLQQTDIGPGAPPMIDINSVAAESVFGYHEGDRFPTNQGTWTATYLGKKKPITAVTRDTR